MSKIGNKLIEIEEALDELSGPHKWKSCQEIADMLEVPVDWVNEVVKQRCISAGLIVDECLG